MAQETANTRMRDFYDVHVLMEQSIDYKVLYDAFMATSKKRRTEGMIERLDSILDEVRMDEAMRSMWDGYRKENFFVGEVTWDDVNKSVKELKGKVFSA